MIIRWVFCACLLLMTGRCTAVAQLNETQAGQDHLPDVEARSLSGQLLRRPEIPTERKRKLLQQLATAERELAENPDDVDNLIWVGRRLAYLWRYNDAIKVFSQGIGKHPDEPKLYRHRGHRYITVRQFDLAIADLKKAAELVKGKSDEVEPDGMPNAAGVPTSTLHTNIWYHLGLAYYLKGQYASALEAYEKCLAASKNNDMKVATLDWMYMTLRRLDRKEEADKRIVDVTPELKIIENTAYHRRLLMYRGVLKSTDLARAGSDGDRELDLATYGYGVGNWYQANGDKEKAVKFYRKVVAGKYWAAFGFIAAEAELARSRSETK